MRDGERGSGNLPSGEVRAGSERRLELPGAALRAGAPASAATGGTCARRVLELRTAPGGWNVQGAAVAAAAAGGVQGQIMNGLGCHAKELRPYRNGDLIKGLLFYFGFGREVKSLPFIKISGFENRF